jgi:hypothetical protein
MKHEGDPAQVPVADDQQPEDHITDLDPSIPVDDCDWEPGPTDYAKIFLIDADKRLLDGDLKSADMHAQIAQAYASLEIARQIGRLADAQEE